MLFEQSGTSGYGSSSGSGSAWARALCINVRNKGTGAIPGKGNLNVSVVCHEVRGLDLRSNDQSYVSVQDVKHLESKTFGQFGEVCNLEGLELDTMVQISVWVDGASSSVVGEIRLPISHLISQYNSCLYHTWITLEMPGLQDSVAHLDIDDTCASLDLAINQGSKKLTDMKACISICRSADVNTDKIAWTSDAAPELRAACWGPLLRSHQQHSMLCAALQLKCDRQDALLSEQQNSTARPSEDSQMSERNRSQAEEIDRLKAELECSRSELQYKQLQLQDAQEQQQQALQQAQQATAAGAALLEQTKECPQNDAQAKLQIAQCQRLADLEAKLAETESREQQTSAKLKDVQRELDEVRVQSESYCADVRDLKMELRSTEAELDRISTEANDKIEAANGRIRTLKCRREEVEQELTTLKQKTVTELRNEVLKLEAQNQQLSEQKEALLSIVDDLHQTCVDAGLEGAGRKSIDLTLRSMRTVKAAPPQDNLKFSFA